MAVAFDATATGNTSIHGTPSFTWNHTTTGSDRAICVAVSIWQDVKSGEVTSVTYGGVTLTEQEVADVVNNNMYTWVGYLINPSTGTNAVVVNMTGGIIQAVGGSVSMTGVDATTPIEDSAQDNGFGQLARVEILTAQTDCFIVSGATKFGTEAVTPNVGTTSRWNTVLGNMVGAGSTKVAATANAYEMEWSWSTNDRDFTIGAIAFAPGTTPSPPASGDLGGFFAASF